MDHSVKAMTNHRKVAFSRLLNRHRFENDELERLFQRYIFKLQHASISSVVALFIVLTAVLAALSLGLAGAASPENVLHAVQCLAFVVLFVVLATKSMELSYLNYVCYVIVAFAMAFAAVSMPVPGLSASQRVEPVDGVWQVVFVVFLLYAMLPLSAKMALALGVSLPVAHTTVAVAATVASDEQDPLGLKWQQVRSLRCSYIMIDLQNMLLIAIFSIFQCLPGKRSLCCTCSSIYLN
jgi:adenylate cyclase 1